MDIKTVPLDQLEADPKRMLTDCADSGAIVVIELPDHRLVAIQSLEAGDDDDLVNRLITSNPAFRELIGRSKQSPRKPFPPSPHP